MKTKKLPTILLVLGSFMAVAGTSSATVISFSGDVSFDHDQVVSEHVYDCPASLTYTFLSDTVSLSQFDPSLGILNSVELIVESDIDVETHFYYLYDTAHASLWWYSNVIGSVNGVEATISQDHNKHIIGQGYHDHVFTIDGAASDSASCSLDDFIGTGLVDVAITGDDKLCAWWNAYSHIDTDTYGTVTVTLIYNYTVPNVISFSGDVSFDHDQVVDVSVYDCPASLTYTFLSDTVSLPQFNPSVGILHAVELIVESDIDVETHFYYLYDTAHASLWWYSNVIGSANGVEATISQDHNKHIIGQGYHDHVFTIDGAASDSAWCGLDGFIGTGLVDVAITGDDKLCAWWNPYEHIDTDTYGTVTATLIYYYSGPSLDIKPGSCPNPLNRRSHGVLPVAVLGSEDFDATEIDALSILLSRADGVGGSVAPNDGPPGPHPEFEDVAAPFEGEVCECDETLPDGILDLSIKFRTREVVQALELNQLDSGDEVELVITGTLLDGTEFTSASDCIVLVPRNTAELAVSSSVDELPVDITPLDYFDRGGGVQQFSRLYVRSSVVTLTAPTLVDGRLFSVWVVDGVPQVAGQTDLEVTLVGDVKATALYRPRPGTTKDPGTGDHGGWPVPSAR